MTWIERNLARINSRIETAAARAGRLKEDVALIAVTKTRSLEEIRVLHGLGIRVIGESRVQELERKYPELKREYEIHFIGHLQSNKAKQAALMADVVHSVDSFRIASALNAECEKLNKTLEVLIQVNTSQETQKSGITPEALPALFQEVERLPNLRVTGLMTMAMISEDSERIRGCFRRLREARELLWNQGADKAVLRHLSMGMSDDFEIAIEEGATRVRVGSALFEQD